MTKINEQLASAVRKSLNLPRLKVSVRRTGPRWLFQLHHSGGASEWIELAGDDIRVMKQLGLLPALQLGTFRVAFAALRRASEKKAQTKQAILSSDS
jgi:hypothetical protein